MEEVTGKHKKKKIINKNKGYSWDKVNKQRVYTVESKKSIGQEMQMEVLPEKVLLEEAPDALINFLESFIRIKYIDGEVDSK